jgi:glutaredoxin
MTKKIYMFSMEGCPHCMEMITMLEDSNIECEIKDIDEDDDEYNSFIQLVDGNEYVPAFLCVEVDENEKLRKHLAIAPDRDFDDLEQGLEIIKEFLK